MEFGLCLQDGEVRACGAGLLSAYGELQVRNYGVLVKSLMLSVTLFHGGNPSPKLSRSLVYFIVAGKRQFGRVTFEVIPARIANARKK